MLMICRTIWAISTASILLSGCAASSKTFYTNPAKVGDTKLCRTFMDAWQKGDQKFATDAANEAGRRGLTYEQCQQKIASEDAAIVGVALVATAVGVAAACQSGCSGGGGGYSRSGSYDEDCAGGPGDGPVYVQGPIQVGGYDPYDLDRDGDGVGCEAGDFGA